MFQTESNKAAAAQCLKGQKTSRAALLAAVHLLSLSAAWAQGPLSIWGRNEEGTLGNGTTVHSNRPVSPSLTGLVATARGSGHTVAVKPDGTVWAWGNNLHGQLGTGSTSAFGTVPVQSNFSGAVSAATGNGATIVLKNDGSVWGWGLNWYGGLGNGTLLNSLTPVQATGVTGITAIASGAFHTLALKSDGTVWAWGNNQFDSVGPGLPQFVPTPPGPVPGLTGIVAIAASYWHSMALKSDGTVWTWGYNLNGQLGYATTGQTNATPRQVPGLTGVVGIAAAALGEHSLAVKSDGTVMAWGGNAKGQLGNGNTTDSFAPVPVSGLTNAVAVAAGARHSMALRGDGSVWNWGYNGYGQLGNCSFADSLVPVQVVGLQGTVTGIRAGYDNGMAIGATPTGTCTIPTSTQGPLSIWGRNDYGQLGNGTLAHSDRPITNGVTGNVTVIGGATDTGFAVKSDGSVWAWGQNHFGQFANGTTAVRVPTPALSGYTGVKAIGGGLYTSHVLKHDGTVWGAGSNNTGQLGTMGGEWLTPFQTSGVTNATALAVGSYHVLALKPDGTVQAWGNNQVGSVGPGFPQYVFAPVTVPGLTGIVAIGAGQWHSVALKNDGTVWTWGEALYGKLGNTGPTTPCAHGVPCNPVPTQVTGLSGVVAIAIPTMGDHNLALKADGTVVAWGKNADGQLGNGTTVDSLTPVPVSGLTNVIALAGGNAHSLALRGDGKLWGWGSNQYGQLGICSYVNSPLPVPVRGLSGVVTAIAAEYHVSMAIGGIPTGDCTAPNAVPTVSANQSAVTANEGSAAANSGTFADTDTGDAVAITASIGTVTKTGANAGSWNWSIATTDGPLAPQNVTITANDGRGGTAATTFTYAVANVAPTVSLSLTPALTEGQTATLNGVITDPGTLDSETVRIVWGDGTADTVIALTAGVRTFSATHVYADDNPTGTPSDTYSVAVTVTDKDSMSSTSTAPIVVHNAVPIVGVPVGPGQPLAIGESAAISAGVSDVGVQDAVTCRFTWGDGSPATVVPPTGGFCRASHSYNTSGVFIASVAASDDDGGSSGVPYQYVTVFDPRRPFVTGGGFFDSPAGALAANPATIGSALFGFVSGQERGSAAPRGVTEFRFYFPGINFSGVTFTSLQVSGERTQLSGSGQINGVGNFGFFVTGIDGHQTNVRDRVRVKIWNEQTNAIVYDNQPGRPESGNDATGLGNGNVVIYTGFVVNTTIDSVDRNPGDWICADAAGFCSLRAAVMTANERPYDDFIYLPAGTYALTLAGIDEDLSRTGDLDVRGNLTLAGDNAATTVIDGKRLDRVFDIMTGVKADLSMITVRDGAVTSGGGGGIRNRGILLLSGKALLTGNQAPRGAAIENLGQAFLALVVISGNSKSGEGAAITHDSTGPFHISQCTIENNKAEGLQNLGTATVRDCTISGNARAGLRSASYLVVQNSTVSDNSPGIDITAGQATLVHATVSENQILSQGTVRVRNSILSDKKAVCTSALTSLGYNVASDGSCGLNGPGDRNNTAADIDKLAANGGPTRTHLPLPGSAAIDLVPAANCMDAYGNALQLDQRLRPRPQGPACDAGAVEVLPVPVSVTINTTPRGRTVTVDGIDYTTDKAFLWLPGSRHTIATYPSQFVSTGVQYAFDSWSDHGTISHEITTPGSALTITATFKASYQLTTSVSPANAGTITPSSSLVPAGQTVTIAATPAHPGLVFAGFSGALTGTTSPQTLVMNGPASVTANFQTAPDLAVAMTHGPAFFAANDAFEYAIAVRNLGQAPTAGLMTLTASLPPGLTQGQFKSVPGGWVCSSSLTLSCSSLGPLPGGASASFRLVGTVSATAPPSLTPSVAVSGGGQVNTGNDTASDPTVIRFRVNVTVSASPNHLEFSVDGQKYTRSVTFAWYAGEQHTVETPLRQVNVPGNIFRPATYYNFSHWSDGGAAKHTLTVQAAPASQNLTAFFQ